MPKQQLKERLFNSDIAIFAFANQNLFSNEPLTATCFDIIQQFVQLAESYLQINERRVHVVELFGGQGHTSNLCSRMFGLTRGTNFEIQCGIDLSQPEDCQYLHDYLDKYKPDVVVMAPPCKGFGPWLHLNKVINPTAVGIARRQGIPLARLCAEIATSQITNGRHFIVEQPRNSTMFDIAEWKSLLPACHVATCDQCRFGLRNSQGVALKKPTKFVASHKMLISYVDGKFCHERHQHGKVTSEAERWPIQLCKLLAHGIADLVTSNFQTTQKS